MSMNVQIRLIHWEMLKLVKRYFFGHYRKICQIELYFAQLQTSIFNSVNKK